MGTLHGDITKPLILSSRVLGPWFLPALELPSFPTLPSLPALKWSRRVGSLEGLTKLAALPLSWTWAKLLRRVHLGDPELEDAYLEAGA